VTQLVKKFPALYEIGRLITVFTRARYWSDLELISEIVNPFKHFGRIPWTEDRTIAKPL